MNVLVMTDSPQDLHVDLPLRLLSLEQYLSLHTVLRMLISLTSAIHTPWSVHLKDCGTMTRYTVNVTLDIVKTKRETYVKVNCYCMLATSQAFDFICFTI